MAREQVIDSVEPSEAAETLLHVEDLHVHYGRAVALRGVTFRVQRGAAVALLGPNGAGKSTTIRAIAGLSWLHDAHVTSGRVIYNGEETTRTPSHHIARRGIAHVPEGRLIVPGMTVEENLRLGATARRSPGSQETLEKCLEQFPVLKKRLHDAGGYLSGGEQQMLAISRALMADPQMLLLDEVSLGLAPLVTREIFESLDSVRRNFGLSMLVVEQNAKLALEFCSMAYVLEGGRVILEGDSEGMQSDEQIQELYLGGHAESGA